MSIYGIVSEFNPFHNGHKYLIESARAEGADAVVCVMSGDAVQRGEFALVDKYYRAEMALRSGADLVLELPFPWCISGAESFARAGVAIAAEFADRLYFGSECGDIELLRSAAEICSGEAFIEEYKRALIGNTGAAEAYFDILESRLGRTFLSNDILGIEYIKAAMVLSAELDFGTVARKGGAYLSDRETSGNIQSATAIRRLIAEGEADRAYEYMPSVCADILKKAIENGDISDAERIDDAIRFYFRLHTADDFSGIADVDEGLASRICRAARESVSADLLDTLRTKRYTDSRLKRAILFCLAGVRKEDLYATPAYVNLLGANQRGCGLLASKRKKGGIPILAKAADIPDDPSAKRQAELSRRFCAIYAMSLLRDRPVSDMMRRSPIII